MQARGRVPVRAVPGAGAGRCRVFARKAKRIGTKNLLSGTKSGVTSSIHGSIGLGNATKTTDTRFSGGF